MLFAQAKERLMAHQKRDQNPRTESARAHDDKSIIDEMEGAPSYVGDKGGNVARELGSRLEVDEILHGQSEVPVKPKRAPRVR
jgi:hypothetical protein